MGIAAGEPADIGDVWLRVITLQKYWKADGTLHNSAFGGRAIAPPDPARPWGLELSGRLLSLIKNIKAESKALCEAPREFAGIMYQTIENLRSEGDAYHRPTGCRTDVFYTPKEDDKAHADLAIYGSTVENKFAIRDWLQESIQCVRPDKCEVIEALRPTQASEPA
jgi:hypothetical protein